jgi:hypothetical protein
LSHGCLKAEVNSKQKIKTESSMARGGPGVQPQSQKLVGFVLDSISLGVNEIYLQKSFQDRAFQDKNTPM